MAIEKVREYFSQYGMENRILEFEVSSATVELAAKAVGIIAKSISAAKTSERIFFILIISFINCIIAYVLYK